MGLGGGPPTPTPARAAQPALESDSLIAPLGGGGGEAARDGTSQAISGGLALRRETVPEAGFLAPRRLVPAHREARAAGPAVSCHRSSPVRGSTAIFDLGRFKLRLVGCSHRRVSCRVPPPPPHTHTPALAALFGACALSLSPLSHKRAPCMVLPPLPGSGSHSPGRGLRFSYSSAFPLAGPPGLASYRVCVGGSKRPERWGLPARDGPLGRQKHHGRGEGGRTRGDRRGEATGRAKLILDRENRTGDQPRPPPLKESPTLPPPRSLPRVCFPTLSPAPAPRGAPAGLCPGCLL